MRKFGAPLRACTVIYFSYKPERNSGWLIYEVFGADEWGQEKQGQKIGQVTALGAYGDINRIGVGATTPFGGPASHRQLQGF